MPSEHLRQRTHAQAYRQCLQSTYNNAHIHRRIDNAFRAPTTTHTYTPYRQSIQSTYDIAHIHSRIDNAFRAPTTTHTCTSV